MSQPAHAEVGEPAADALVDAVLPDVAHDIANPLAIVQSNLQNVLEYAADLKRVIQAFRSGDPATANRISQEIDLEFVLEDVDRATREALGGVGRVRALSTAVGALGGVAKAPTRIDLRGAAAHAVSLAGKSIAGRARIDLSAPVPVEARANAALAVRSILEAIRTAATNAPTVAVSVAEDDTGPYVAIAGRHVRFDPAI